MELEPFDWNVVVAAYWNRAILTPNGIAKRLFKIPEGTAMEVFVPVDLLEPPQVKYEGTTVRVEDRRLVITANKGDFRTLSRAMELARNALGSLPDTPVLAAGFNVRFKTLGGHDEIECLVASTELDGCLSDNGYEIVGRLIGRKIRCRNTAFEKGILTLSLDTKEETAMIQLNFQRDSREVEELIDWLNIPIKDIEDSVNTVLLSCGHTACQEKEHV